MISKLIISTFNSILSQLKKKKIGMYYSVALFIFVLII